MPADIAVSVLKDVEQWPSQGLSKTKDFTMDGLHLTWKKEKFEQLSIAIIAVSSLPVILISLLYYYLLQSTVIWGVYPYLLNTHGECAPWSIWGGGVGLDIFYNLISLQLG